MLSELLAVAQAGAGALLGAAATDAWGAAKAGAVKLFRRSGPAREKQVERLLEEDMLTIARAEPAGRDRVRSQLAPAWTTRLADLLEEHPELVSELQDWTGRVQSMMPAPNQGWAQVNTAEGGGTIFAVQAGNQYVSESGAHPTNATGSPASASDSSA